ncbi:cyclohexanone monooxygenase [Exophiala viscosa]|uniref:cyclohexanone monooxygenase n=1 Tax=Exophiala viscosa TaxID=2486360 RepID=UPI0021A1945E|nr:cyclohexanone monooxygenase [Exophiala viscosa]
MGGDAGDMPWPQVVVGNKNHTEAAVVIIGGGISGMCTAIDLIKRNNCRNFIILEKSGGLGGTWRDNKYPGCCCDVFSHLYSLSFEQNSDWTREYPGQEEILQYLMEVARKYDLYRYVRFNTAVDSAKWDDADKKWKTTVSVQGAKDAEFGSTYTIASDFLVSAVGQLNVPQLPDIPGLNQFKGKIMHSARWDWSYDIRGKKVAIIGNGATAAQIIPEIAKEVGHLTIHQRTPNWIVPRLDAPIAPWRRNMYKYVPMIRWRKRAEMMDFRESVYDAVFDNASSVAQDFETLSKGHMHTQLPDRPDLWEKLQPNYSIGCKRIIISDDYFPVFQRDNVKLETGRIDNITANGIVTEGKEEDYDLIVLATGFRTLEFMHPIDVTGSAGRPLSSIWKDGGQALYGVTVESLPNFAMLYGPNTNLGHNSIILMIEAQSRYINALIREVLTARGRGHSLVIQPKAARIEEFNDGIQGQLRKSSFADPNCNSWYKKGDGKITNNWSGTVIEYQKLLSDVNWSDFDLSGNEADEVAGRQKTHIGRVVEESVVSYQTMALTALSLAAVGAGIALRNAGRLRLR